MKTDRQKTFIRMVPTLSGQKRKYEFVSLSRREAVETAHNSLMTVLSAVSTVAARLFAGKADGGDDTDKQKIAEDIVGALSTVKFSTLWEIARPVFRGVFIDDVIQIDDLEKTDYFDDRVDEFYSALVLGVEGNYPAVFSKVRGFLNDSGLPDITTRFPGISKG